MIMFMSILLLLSCWLLIGLVFPIAEYLTDRGVIFVGIYIGIVVITVSVNMVDIVRILHQTL